VHILNFTIVTVETHEVGFLGTSIQFSDYSLGLETSVLRKCAGDYLECLAKAFTSVLVEARLLLSKFRDLICEINFRGTTSGNHAAIFSQRLNGVDSIVNSAFSVFEERCGRSA